MCAIVRIIFSLGQNGLEAKLPLPPFALPKLVLRPSHHPVFDCLLYTKAEEECLVYHINDIGVYLNRDLRPKE